MNAHLEFSVFWYLCCCVVRTLCWWQIFPQNF